MERCDCLNECGDDRRVAAGKVRKCPNYDRLQAEERQRLAQMELLRDPDVIADAMRFRWLCAHPDWHCIERLCREFVADSSMEFLTELRRVIDARRSIELGPFDEHRPANE